MTKKLQITKLLILFGFILSVTNYGVKLIDFYASDEKSSIVFEETENSEKKEKENSEKEEFKEKEKISQDHDEKTSSLADTEDKFYPDFYFNNSSVYLEYTTPPPELS